MAGSNASGLARASRSNEGRGPPPRAPSAIIRSRPLIIIISNIMIISSHRGSWRNIIWEHPLIFLNINLGHRDDIFNHGGMCVPSLPSGRSSWTSMVVRSFKSCLVFSFSLYGAFALVSVRVSLVFFSQIRLNMNHAADAQ